MTDTVVSRLRGLPSVIRFGETESRMGVLCRLGEGMEHLFIGDRTAVGQRRLWAWTVAAAQQCGYALGLRIARLQVVKAAEFRSCI